MSISKDMTISLDKGTSTAVLRPPRLTVIAGANQAGTTIEPVGATANADADTNERDWDPYLVWKKLIRKNPD